MQETTDLLPVRRSWLTRALAWLRIITVTSADSHSYGHGFGSGVASPPTYSHLKAMSALGAFGWIRALADIVSADLASLPIVVTRKEGDARVVVADHPLLALMAQPSTHITGNVFRRQLVIDFCLTGNAYILMLPVREAGGSALQASRVHSLIRLHPHRVLVHAGSDGQPEAYEFNQNGGAVTYSADDVIHVRGPSWTDDPTMTMGEGWIRALDKALTALEAADTADAKAAQMGRPAIAAAPKDSDSWTQKQVDSVTHKLVQAFSKSHGGIFVNGKGIDFDTFGWSASDMERPAHREWIRQELMAVAKVPPTKVGLKIANYATAKQEDKVHWQARMGEAALIDTELTRLAQRLTGNPTDKVHHQFSHLEAFQLDRTERLKRVDSHVRLAGMSLAEAYAYEGFEDAPVEEVEDSADIAVALNGAQVQSATSIVAEVAAGRLPRDSGVAMLIAFFGLTQEAAEGIMGSVGRGFKPATEGTDTSSEGGTEDREVAASHHAVLPFERWWQRSNPPETRQERDALWKELDDLRNKREAEMQRVTLKALRSQLKRISQRLRAALASSRMAIAAGGEGAELLSKGLSASQWVAVLDTKKELSTVTQAITPAVVRMHTAAVLDTATRMGIEVAAEELAKKAERIAAETAKQMQTTTDAVVRDLVETGLGEGSEAAKLLSDLAKSRAFRSSRAELVARTATTRTLNAGAVASMTEAEKQGLTVKKQWLATSDEYTRDTHAGMDGQKRDIDAPFSNENGEAMHPGGFGVAEEDINCRCTVLPVVE